MGIFKVYAREQGTPDAPDVVSSLLTAGGAAGVYKGASANRQDERQGAEPGQHTAQELGAHCHLFQTDRHLADR